jgi:hypothetical protein
VEKDTLTFPDDDITAWKVLLYWIIKHELPCNEQLLPKHGPAKSVDHPICIRCWALGDKYGIPIFQDLIMLELLDSVENNSIHVSRMREAFECTPPGSALRKLMVEIMAENLHEKPEDVERLDMFDGAVGFTKALMQTMDRKDNDGEAIKVFRPRVPDVEGENRWKGHSAYREFMIASNEGPAEHWLHRRINAQMKKARKGKSLLFAVGDWE